MVWDAYSDGELGEGEGPDRDGVYGLELVTEGEGDGEDQGGFRAEDRVGYRGEGRAGDRSGSRGSRAFSEATADQRETIGDDSPRRLPRALRFVGVVAVAAAVATMLWPSGGSRGSKSGPAQVRMHLAGATLKPSGRITTLTLLLANDTTSAASIGEADIRDADGRRVGADRRWPAGDIAGGSTLAVDIAVPYVCDTHYPQHVPVTLHVSVVSSGSGSGSGSGSSGSSGSSGAAGSSGSSSRLEPPRELSYPVDPWTWQEFERFQSGVCDVAGSGVKVGAVSLAAVQPAPETRAVRVLTEISVKEPLTLDGVFAANPALRVTADPQPPSTVPAAGWQAIATTWQVPDCAAMAGRWSSGGEALVLAYEGPTGGTSLTVPVPDDVVARVAEVGCPG